MLIDVHTHCFPDKIAPHAIEQLYARCKLPPRYDGTRAGLLKTMQESGVDRAVTLSIATNPHQMKSVNDFAIELQKEEALCAFGSVHPDAPDALEELSRIKAAGLRGVKLHPDYIGYMVDDEKLYPIYDALSELKLPLLIHAGFDYVSPTLVHARPEATARVVRAFPRLTLIAAHMGGMRLYDEVKEHLLGQPLYLDTSMLRYNTSEEIARELLLGHDPDRLLFGSDGPWSDPAEDLKFLQRLDLPTELMDKICWKNALALGLF